MSAGGNNTWQELLITGFVKGMGSTLYKDIIFPQEINMLCLDFYQEMINIFCRIRPLLPIENAKKYTAESIKLTKLDKNQDIIKITDENGKSTSFTFDKVYDTNSTQSDIFNDIKPKLINTMKKTNPRNLTIMTYGRMATGKRYTLYGGRGLLNNPIHEQRGIIPRTIEYVQNNQSGDAKLKCSIIEIYSGIIRDLISGANEKKLELFGDDKTKQKPELFKMQYGAWQKYSANAVYIESIQDFHSLYSAIKEYQRITCTQFGTWHGRYHLMITFEIMYGAKIYFVQLGDALIHKKKKAAMVSSHQIEHKWKWKAFSALSEVLTRIKGNEAFIPYRDCKVTDMLWADGLGGNNGSQLILCINVTCTDRHVKDTMSVLEYGDKIRNAKEVRVNPRKKH